MSRHKSAEYDDHEYKIAVTPLPPHNITYSCPRCELPFTTDETGIVVCPWCKQWQTVSAHSVKPNIENQPETDLARTSIMELEFSTVEFTPQIKLR